MSFKIIKSYIQFCRGTSLVWNAMTKPLPAGVMSFSIDDGTFKLGDGVSLYTDLPSMFTYADLVSAQGGASGLFVDPTTNANGKIVVAYFDEQTNAVKYAPSAVSLADLLSMVNSLETTNAQQDSEIATLLAVALDIDVSINTAANDNVIIVSNGRYSDSGLTTTALRNQVAAQVSLVPGYQLMEPVMYADAAKATVVDRLALNDDTSYYLDVLGFNNSAACVFGVSAANPNVTVTNVSGSLFKIKLSKVTANTNFDTPIVLIISVGNAGGTSLVRKAITCKVLHNNMMVSIYGGAALDIFREATIDSAGNYICVGRTLSEGAGSADALIVKYDASLNLIWRKRLGGTALDYFTAVATDASNNIFACGYSVSELANGTGIIVKFSSSGSILYKKRFTTSSGSEFLSLAVDDAGSFVYACGWTATEGAGGNDAIIAKFYCSSLTINARRVYGGTGNEVFQKVAIDNAGNIICVGETTSEGTGTPATNALIVKYDTSLNILGRKYFGGSGADSFYGVCADSSNNIYVVGNTASEGAGAVNGMLFKFDSSLTVLFKKIIGAASGSVNLFKVAVDSNGNIFCAGSTSTEGLGNKEALIIELDNTFAILKKKRYGGTGDDMFYAVNADASGNVYCAGQMSSNGFGDYDAFAVKLPNVLPVGTYSGVIVNGLTLADCTTMVMADSANSPATSTLTDAASTAAFTDATVITLAASTLSFVRDAIN